MSVLVVSELAKFMEKFRGGGGGGEYWKLFQCFQGIFLMMSYDLIILIRRNDCCVKIFDKFCLSFYCCGVQLIQYFCKCKAI